MRRFPLYLVAILLLASTVSWRHGVYYSGGVDPVVAGKGLIGVAALALAWRLSRTAVPRRPLGSWSGWMLALFLIASFFGAWSGGTLVASGVLIVRLIIVAGTVFFMLRSAPAERVVEVLAITMTAFVAVAAGTGIGSAASGRLNGGIPPLNPNEIAQLCGIVILVLVWRSLNGSGRVWDGLGIVVLLGVTWATGSRTGLTALVPAIIVMLLQARRLPVPVFVTLIAVVPLLAYVVFGTTLISSYIGRGGSANIGTLSERTVAWEAAIHLPKNFWDEWFGGGLSVRKIPVVAKYRNTQDLDSSWVSAFVQAGIAGLGVLAFWSLRALAAAFFTRNRVGQLSCGILIFLIARGFLESGLMDATPAFVMFFLFSVVDERRSQQPPVDPDGLPRPLERGRPGARSVAQPVRQQAQGVGLPSR